MSCQSVFLPGWQLNLFSGLGGTSEGVDVLRALAVLHHVSKGNFSSQFDIPPKIMIVFLFYEYLPVFSFSLRFQFLIYTIRCCTYDERVRPLGCGQMSSLLLLYYSGWISYMSKSISFHATLLTLLELLYMRKLFTKPPSHIKSTPLNS
jgi:hypothetical protein